MRLAGGEADPFTVTDLLCDGYDTHSPEGVGIELPCPMSSKKNNTDAMIAIMEAHLASDRERPGCRSSICEPISRPRTNIYTQSKKPISWTIYPRRKLNPATALENKLDPGSSPG